MKNEKIFVTRSSMPSYEEYIEAIKPLWDSHWLTNMGQYHQELEERLKEYLEVSELSLMVNGHMALELAIQAMNFPEGAEVITTPFTFISTTHAIVRNHLKPVFCDVKPEDGTLCGVCTHLIFKGVHYEMEVTTPDGFEWLVHSTDMCPVGTKVGIHVDPFDIQIMNKPASEDEEAVGVNE